MNEEPAPAAAATASNVPAAAPDATALLEPRKVLAAASDPVRWGILRELAAGPPLPVNELAARLGRTPDLMSKHLRVLRDARLLVAVEPADGDGRKQFHAVPAPFRTRDAAGRVALDFGAVLLRFG